MKISEATRLDIIDFLRVKKIKWYGRLDDINFLSRVYDLTKFPSTDHRFDTAEDDIKMHRNNFDDWDDDWIFEDDRFNLQRCSDSIFLRFLCEMLNPRVRPKPSEVNMLLKKFNKYLALDGVELYAKGHILRRRLFAARAIQEANSKPADKKRPVQLPPIITATGKIGFDFFICHASEDKISVARPLAGHLVKLGFRVWYDEFAMKLGDSLRRSIDRGLATCRYGIVVLSPSFFAKHWPRYELDGMVQRENSAGTKVILPIWHQITRDQISAHSPTLADRIAVQTSEGLEVMCSKISEAAGNAHRDLLPTADIESIKSSEICPKCGKKGKIYGFEGGDGDEFHWFECSHCANFTSFE